MLTISAIGVGLAALYYIRRKRARPIELSPLTLERKIADGISVCLMERTEEMRDGKLSNQGLRYGDEYYYMYDATVTEQKLHYTFRRMFRDDWQFVYLTIERSGTEPLQYRLMTQTETKRGACIQPDNPLHPLHDSPELNKIGSWLNNREIQ